MANYGFTPWIYQIFSIFIIKYRWWYELDKNEINFRKWRWMIEDDEWMTLVKIIMFSYLPFLIKSLSFAEKIFVFIDFLYF